MRYEKLRYEHLRTKKCDAEKSIRTFVLGPSRNFEAGRRQFMETKPRPRSEKKNIVQGSRRRLSGWLRLDESILWIRFWF